MNTVINPAAHEKHLCPKCGATGVTAEISQNGYRCRQCSYELAHVDLATNGAVRGIFGWLKEVGDLVGDRYKVQTVLGRGGFGATYLVEDQRVKGKRWALKEIPQMLFDEFEMLLLSKLDHPAIPIIADRFTENEMVYLVLKFGGTRTLSSETKKQGRIAYAELKSWVIQIGNVLEYLHSRTPPIIHRDLKPENVLLDDAGRIMVIDFGIAKESIPANMTRTLGRAASYGYSPPEQIMGTGTDTRSDIYSLAATVYFALTGMTPIPAHERMAGKPIPAPSKIVPDLPDDVNDIVLRGLNLNINERPQTVKEFTDVFDRTHPAATDILMSDKTVRITERTISPTVKPATNYSKPSLENAAATTVKPPQRNAWIILTGVILTLVIITASGIYWLLTKQNETQPVIKPPIATNDEPVPPVSSSPSSVPASPPVILPSSTQTTPLPAVQPTNTQSALDILKQRRQPQSAENYDEPPADNPVNAENEPPQPSAPKTAVSKYTAKPTTSRPKTKKIERKPTPILAPPSPAPAPEPENASSNPSWVIIPGQTQKKY